MNQPGNIIVTTDFSAAARRAYPLAASMARRFKSRLHLIHFASARADRFSGQTNEEHVAEIHRALKHEAAREEFANLSVSRHRLDKQIAISMPLFEVQVNGDLVITAARRDTPFEQYFLTSHSEELLTHSAIPVLVNGVTGESIVAGQPIKVLVPFASQPGMMDAISALQFLTNTFVCEFRFLFVQPGTEENRIWFDRLLGFRKKPDPDAAESRFEETMKLDFPDVVADFRKARGIPSKVVAEQARELAASLVLVGQRGFREGVAKRIVYQTGLSTLKVPATQAQAGSGQSN